MPDARHYVERGIASWYGNKFHGYMTSSLEPYDMYQFSAAHKTLPLPSYVRVTNLDNGKSVVVRVNDRGPFHENRLIDLSYAAAVTHRRLAERYRPGRSPRARSGRSGCGTAWPMPRSQCRSGDPRIFLQLGAFADRGNAQRVLGQVQRAGIGRVGNRHRAHRGSRNPPGANGSVAIRRGCRCPGRAHREAGTRHAARSDRQLNGPQCPACRRSRRCASIQYPEESVLPMKLLSSRRS